MSELLGGHLVARQLVACGVETVFAVAGESYLGLLDGLYDVQQQVRTITVRHEGAAAMMAAAHGRLTGRPGVCLVTRGPGATNGSIGVHIASQDAVPMLLLVGQVPTSELGSRAFQEVDLEAMFAPLAKSVVSLTDSATIPGEIADAYRTAIAGEPGPVVVVMPEDVLMSMADASTVAVSEEPALAADRGVVQAVAAELDSAERPLAVLGGAGWDAESRAAFQSYAELGGIAVVCAFRQQDLLDNDSPAYAGALGLHATPGIERVVAEADVVLVLGSRPDAITAGSLSGSISDEQRLVHVHPGETPSPLRGADVDIVCDPASFARALASTGPTRRAGEWQLHARSGLLALRSSPPDPRAAAYLAVLDKHLPDDVILTCGAGSYTAWMQRYHSYTGFPAQVGPQAGAMGYGLPAAIAAKLALPDRTVVAFAGDGCLQMSGQELATIGQYDLRLVVVVVDNGSFGAIRAHQENHFPGRRIATDLSNPDFVAWARSFGLSAARVSSPEELESALPDLLDSGASVLVQIDEAGVGAAEDHPHR